MERELVDGLGYSEGKLWAIVANVLQQMHMGE
jgi:hypothetical protein